MRIVLLLTAAVLGANCLPVPVGQIVKYRIPTKYFGKQNATAQEDNSLYNYLSLIHFGGAAQTSVPVSINAIQVDDVSHDGLHAGEPEREAEAMTTDSTTNESPGASDNVTELDQQMDVVKANDDGEKSAMEALIEKVVNDEIKKLADEEHVLSSLASLSAINQQSAASGDVMSVELFSTTDDPDTETIFPTEATLVEAETTKIESSPSKDEVSQAAPTAAAPSTVSPDREEANDESEISDSLLSAVGDLLSSILGLDASSLRTKVEDSKPVVAADRVDSSTVTEETVTPSEPLSTPVIPFELQTVSEIEQGTERSSGMSTPGLTAVVGGEESGTTGAAPLRVPSDVDTNRVRVEIVSEVDAKIENLANAQTSFATEDTPEHFTETLRDGPSEPIKVDADVLEVIVDEEKPVSFEESVNHVMNLVKGDEGRLALREAMLLDKKQKDAEEVDRIVLSRLKELGMQHDVAFEPMDVHRDNIIKTIESEIIDSNKHHIDNDDFVPNSAKAALHYKHLDRLHY